MSKLALVTGGSRGIGQATVARLRERGWDVLAPTRAELDMANFTQLMGTMGRWLKAQAVPIFNALVFCHGEWYSRIDSDQVIHDWVRLFESRVAIPWALMDFLTHGQVPVDSVTTVSSTQAFGGRSSTGPYGAACAAQVRLITGLAQLKDGTRYNVVCPGITDTAMYQQVKASGDCKPDAVPQPPSAVAQAIVGLVEGDDNGAVLRVVDGQVTRARWVWE